MAEQDWVDTPLPNEHIVGDTSAIAPEFNKLRAAVAAVRTAITRPTGFANSLAAAPSAAAVIAILTGSNSVTFQRSVQYGTDASVPRPANVPNGGVYWVGSGTVLPSNAMSADIVYLP